MLYGAVTYRYSSRPFPAYRFVPGKAPHPTRSPDGHSFGRESAPIALDERSWRESDDYLYAIDLLNHGYYWEAHEALEAIWLGSGRDTPIGIFAQGLIQAAAALLKHSMGESGPATRLVAAATEKLRASAPTTLGVDTRKLVAALESTVAGRSAQPPGIALEGVAALPA